MSALEKKLLSYAKNNLNVLLIGSHGIGKTENVKAVAKQLNLKFKYYSASTLDPFADIVGIPVPDKENRTLNFFRPKDLEDAEFIMFDELNRAHPRVLNAVLEIIQFKTVNGTALKNLKMIWAAVNPPGEDYQVEELDPALVDRFHIFIKMKPEINVRYLSSVMPETLVRTLKDWWEHSLGDEQRKIFTPRRVEYLGMLIDKNIPWRDCFPQGHTFPIDDLSKKLRIMNKEEEEEVAVNKENLLKNPELFKEKVKSNPEYAISVVEYLMSFSEDQLFLCRDVLEAMPKELIFKIAEKRFPQKRRSLKVQFVNGGVDHTLYPKVSEAFEFNK